MKNPTYEEGGVCEKRVVSLIKVKLMQGGTIFEDVVIVSKFEDAKKTALMRNPTARVVAMNPFF